MHRDNQGQIYMLWAFTAEWPKLSVSKDSGQLETTLSDSEFRLRRLAYQSGCLLPHGLCGAHVQLQGRHLHDGGAPPLTQGVIFPPGCYYNLILFGPK